MSWPLISEFLPLLKTPKVAFADEVLRECVIETDARNQPLPRSGNFASVFKAYTDNGNGSPVAVRIFSRQVPERRDRYQIVSNFLARNNTESIVDFAYIERGIRSSSGHFYPIVTMDWIEGESLYERIARACEESDGNSIRNLADRWLRMDEQHLELGISHGDLQHANVIVTPTDDLKLVDYDCFYVPELAGRPNLEVGIPPYQHPDRNDRTLLSERLHFFSSQFIFTALRCLAHSPQLWHEYVTAEEYDKLLFRPLDLQRPEDSKLIHYLRNCGDPIVAALVESLLESYRNSIEHTRPLRYIVRDIEGAANPYLLWFGVETDRDQAPNYYDLLGINRNERDADRIRQAAENRLSQLLTHCTTDNHELALRLIREINAAQLTLLNAKTRRDYDRYLIDSIPVATVVPTTRNNPSLVPRPPVGTTQLPLNELDTVQIQQETHPVTEDADTQSIRCPFCQMPMNVPTTMATRALRCVSCGQMFQPEN